MKIEHLFVYGSLCPGCPNAHILETIGGTFQKATIKGVLKENGWAAELGFPGLVISADGEAVEGYIFSSVYLSSFWEKIDEFEGDEYQRTLSQVQLNTGEVMQVHVYSLAEVNQ